MDELTQKQKQRQAELRQIEQEMMLDAWIGELGHRLEPIQQQLNELKQAQRQRGVPMETPPLPSVEELEHQVFDRLWAALQQPLLETFEEVKRLQHQVKANNDYLKQINTQLVQQNQQLQQQVKALSDRWQVLENYQKQTLQPHINETGSRLKKLEDFKAKVEEAQKGGILNWLKGNN